ncbi:MAG: VWA domain-containing protein [Myxococcales bacterium]|nr:VWA domain-containing protein [Myxococcales bacterium]
MERARILSLALTFAAMAACGGGDSDSGAGGGNIDLGGSGDIGYFRQLLNQGVVPQATDLDSSGFFAEHYLVQPPAECGERVCVQGMLAVMPDLLTGSQTAMLQLGLNTNVAIDPDNRPPLTMSVVVDVSGSMEGKIADVRAALATLIGELRDDDMLSLVRYSDSAAVIAPMGLVGDDRSELFSIAEDLVAAGGTNLYAGLELGYQQVQSAFDIERQNRVILLSDGNPTVGTTSTEGIEAMSAGYNSEGLAITSIGLGTSFNVQLMRGLAEQGNGNHYFLENTAAIEEVFTEELAYFTVPVAFDVTLDVQAGSLYDFKRAYGSSFWQDNPTGGSISVPSVFIAHRVSHDDTTPGGNGGRRGGGSALLLNLEHKTELPVPAVTEAEVAQVNVTFRESGATEPTSQSLIMNYPFAPDSTPPQGYFDASDPAIVHKSFAMLNLYRSLERGCADYHSGLGTHAIWTLRRVEAAIIDYNEELYEGEGDEDMTADLELLRQLIDVMIANGAIPPTDLDLPADPWPAD